MTETKKSTTRGTSASGWTDEERAAMKEHAEELKRAKKRGGKASKADGESDVLEKIAEMPDADRAMAERIHSIVKEAAPDLAPRTWYGMPAYAKDGKVVCFFTAASKFNERYASFGFNAAANLDEGSMWPTAWALTRLSKADEKEIARLVKKAVS
ncbi:MAG TPA: DUF1801 domain-containing protein [Candidatus Angelobacter sp.]|nr:DUF1801 domain-containing protein [Candidatus Angelobacter sp.]